MAKDDPGRSRGRGPFIACAALLLIHGMLSFSAVSGKSPTFDEPLHAVACDAALNFRDFRMDFDNPPLWKYWAALPNLASPLSIDRNDPQWSAIPRDLFQQWVFAIRIMYRNPANDPDRYIARSRFMMLMLALALGALIARWAWEIGGPTAAVAATILFAFDPNYLAHGSLVKNDVALALMMIAIAYSVWKLGQTSRWRWNILAGAACGAGCAVKFSGVLLPMIAIGLILLRAIMPQHWEPRDRPAQRFTFSTIWIASIALISFTMIWAVYCFRFSVSSDPTVHINTGRIIATIARNESGESSLGAPFVPPMSMKFILWNLRHHLLPEAWLNGLLFVIAGSMRRPSFLMGTFRDTGWWMYYPIAIAVKEPLATLAAMILAAGVLVRRVSVQRAWTIFCLMIPPAMYALAAILTPANAGIRHVLPVFPFAFIACGIAVKRMSNRWQRWIAWGLGGMLAIETICAYPDYIAFFNVAAGGERGGIRWLSDSNLDWGQDLPLLARWQINHPDIHLYLCYFGTADPHHYGIEYQSLPGGFVLDPPPQPMRQPGVIAISATNLQGLYSGTDLDLRTLYAPLRNQQPIDVLGGSIYLFKYPATD